MARTLKDHLDADGRPKRILALDGGGVKGLLALGMAKALEDELRRRSGDQNLVLSDYYDLIGGTSTGAIVATGLALGLPVNAMIELYQLLGPRVFGRRAGDGLFSLLYDPRLLRAALEGTLGRRTLGSPDLRTGLAIHMKRIDTGSPWVLTNNPAAVYFDSRNSDSAVVPNRKYRLIDLVMASAAAPTFFDEVVITIARDDDEKPIQKGYFVDGAVGANNNPAMQLFMLAQVPAYGFRWPAGPDRLMMTSIGTGMRRPQIDGKKFQNMLPGQRGIHALRSMIYDTQVQGVMMMQTLSDPKKPWRINSEVEDMVNKAPGRPLLLDYQRIDAILDLKPRKVRGKPVERSVVETMLDETLTARDHLGLDSLANGAPRNMRFLLALGLAAGKTYVGPEYPDPRFNLEGWRS